ncbi:MAG: C25 family cysteine peptidase [Candidatus Electryonea clarkiae]|nr:C25 family cysteine peptidase [Candidatus Electryonea clarkiae]MDP8286055.1 C25 family cysteine peptidase [Candidatus Electryonea clarkiae]
MKKVSLVAVLFFAVIGLVFGATQQRSADDILPVKVLDRVITENGMELSLEIKEPAWSSFKDDGAAIETAEFVSGGALIVEGYPSVPVVGRMFRIPPRSGVIVETLDSEYETFTEEEYTALYGDAGFFDEVNSDLDENSWYPGMLAAAGEPAVFHDFRVSNLITYPVQVNTALREVRVYNNIQVNVRFEGVDDRNTIPTVPTAISEAFLPWYRLMLDWDENELDEYEVYHGNVVVVMENNDVIWEALAPWIEWKRQRGWDLEFLTDDDVDNFNANGIRSALTERFTTSSPKFDYVVFIGDASGGISVPAATQYGDHPYSLLAGNDQLSDVGVGRISVTSANMLNTYVNKVLTYERDIDFDNTAWYRRGMVARSNTGAGVSKVMLMRYARRCMLNIGYTRVDSAYSSPYGIGNVRSRSITAINSGLSLYFDRGYLGTGIPYNSSINLTNTNMTPFVIDITCGTGNWVSGNGNNEGYMRAGTPNSARGAIGAIGMATSGTSVEFNNCIGGGSLWAILQLRVLALGDIILGGKVNGWNNFAGNNDGRLNQFLDWYNLMGDPTVWVWTGTPLELDVTAANRIELGENSYSITVEADRDPLPDAWVTLYKVDDNEDIVVKGKTDQDGELTLHVPFAYTGDAILTVSKQHFAPDQTEISVVSPDARVSYADVTIIDDGTRGTIGNDNGKADAGETIGLEITAKNFGNDDETDVSVTLDSNEPWVLDIDGDIDYGNLEAGASSEGQGVILVNIDIEAQKNWNLNFDVEFSTEADDYTGTLQVSVNAPLFAMYNINGANQIDPGEEDDIIVELMNVGTINVGSSTALLRTLDPYMDIVEGDAEYDAMNVGEYNGTSFTIAAHEATIPGHVARAYVVIETEEGYVDTTCFSIVLGSKSEGDPCGPDRYGYYAFEDSDTDFEDHAPEFEWVEINPYAQNNDYNGTVLNINDTSENDDEAIRIDLPFDIQYYGNEFDELTVMGNGMVAFGNQRDVSLARNWTIPSALGPDNMVAPYWDELRTGGNCRICYYYDQPNGRFIVEWYKIRGSSGGEGTFEVIFYTQNERPTRTGDAEILFQYDGNITITTTTQYNVPGYTVGIENGTQSDGILFSFYGEEYPGSAGIEDERAILFTTDYSVPSGSIEGTVTDLESGDPLPDILVQMTNGFLSTYTDDEGYYRFDGLLEGVFGIELVAECFNPGLRENIEVMPNEVAEADYEMIYPLFSLDPEEIIEFVPADTQHIVTMTVANYGNGPLDFSSSIEFSEDALNNRHGDNNGENELDDRWDELLTFELTEEESRNRGVVFFKNHFIVSGSNNFDPVGPNFFYIYDSLGVLASTIDQPVPEDDRTAQGIFAMTSDGQYFYGVDNGILYQMDIDFESEEAAVSDTITAPILQAKYLVYDDIHDLFWMGDITSDVYAINRNGDAFMQVVQDFSPRGAGWYAEDPNGFKLYFFCRATGVEETRIVRMDAETGESQVVATFDDPEGNMVPTGADITYLWDPNYWTLVSVLDNGAHDSLKVWEISDYTAWAELLNPGGSLDPGDSTDISVRIRSTGLPRGLQYSCWVYYEHNACTEDNEVVVITMDTEDEVDIDELTVQPLEWNLGDVYPNPFNPTTSIRFSLKENVMVNARVFNILGQEVAELANRPMTAGFHSLTFNGADMASGMYFLRFEAGPLNDIKKMIIMK